MFSNELIEKMELKNLHTLVPSRLLVKREVNMDLALKNKAVLVTGGSHGLGKALCLGFAAEGASIAVNYRRNLEETITLIEEIKQQYGVKAIAVQGDVTREADVKRIFRESVEKLSGLDILVNNAGICPTSMVKDMTLEEWNNVIGTNLTGAFLTCREMVNMLLKLKKRGNIVNIASQSAYNGSKSGKSHYSASKGGLVTFTLSLAKEAAADGIRINAVAPGMMYTEMTADTLDKNMDRYKREIPLGRIAEMEEVVKAVLFLSSEVSSYITGTTVDVSGGIIGV